MTKLGIPQAIQGLKFLDPNKQDPSIQGNISMLKTFDGWAGLKFASVRLKYSQMSMDMAMDGFLGWLIINPILEGVKIRNFNIMPIMSNSLDPVIASLTPAPKEDKEGDISQELAKQRAEEEHANAKRKRNARKRKSARNGSSRARTAPPRTDSSQRYEEIQPD